MPRLPICLALVLGACALSSERHVPPPNDPSTADGSRLVPSDPDAGYDRPDGAGEASGDAATTADSALPPCADRPTYSYGYEIRNGALICSATGDGWHVELVRAEAGDPVCELVTPIGVVVLSNTRPALVELRCAQP